jgi:hypothetical protein
MIQNTSKFTELKIRPCRHLCGKEYNEYILRTQTRSLGGISLDFRARAIRQLFPYKPFAPLGHGTTTASRDDSDVEMSGDETSVKREVPQDGNQKTKQAEWTTTEFQAQDNELMAYAKWEVNYAGRYVVSCWCRRTTTNISMICDECELLAKDVSFLQAVRKVSCNLIPMQ